MHHEHCLDAGRRFVIRTDHSALQSLRKTPEPIGQQVRWQTFIEQFTFTIMHRPGTQHHNAEALSRRLNDHDENGNETPDRCGRMTATQTEEKEEPTTGDHSTASAGETMTELQQHRSRHWSDITTMSEAKRATTIGRDDHRIYGN